MVAFGFINGVNYSRHYEPPFRSTSNRWDYILLSQKRSEVGRSGFHRKVVESNQYYVCHRIGATNRHMLTAKLYHG